MKKIIFIQLVILFSINQDVVSSINSNNVIPIENASKVNPYDVLTGNYKSKDNWKSANEIADYTGVNSFDLGRTVGEYVPKDWGKTKYDYGVGDVEDFQNRSIEDIRAERGDTKTKNIMIGISFVIFITCLFGFFIKKLMKADIK